MDTVEGTLGQALILLANLAVVLFAVIVVLLQADFILGRLEKLSRRWAATWQSTAGSDPPCLDQGDPEPPHDGQGAQ